MSESNDYYHSQCKQCGEDCDGDFCSTDCRENWNDGYGDYIYEKYRDACLDEQWGSL